MDIPGNAVDNVRHVSVNGKAINLNVEKYKKVFVLEKLKQILKSSLPLN